MSQDFSGRVALITGGASGIGAETAAAFVAAGARVAVCDNNADAGAALAVRLGDACHFIRADLRLPKVAEPVVTETAATFGRLDIVLNNAGLGLNAPLVDHSDQQIEDLIAVNLRAAILISRAALPLLLANERGGVIINNASNGGAVGRAPDPVYAATKHGIVGLTKSLALAHAHQRIRVNAICPGAIDTPMLWGNFTGVPREDAMRKILAAAPDPRIAAASEVAALVLYLASDEARYINGVSLPIDGGKAAGIMPSNRYRLDFDLSPEMVEPDS